MNRLQNAISPYLRQHAENPVDWFPWGEEAFALAKQTDRPILLSVGYSACHWCHVMAHESFEDAATAAIMNRDFVCVKVDREERPDIDDIYMQATLIFNQGHGGWPMTAFLTPDGRPFHAGTYYPKEDRYGMPSFKRVMAAVTDAYVRRRAQVEASANDITDGLQRDLAQIRGSADDLNADLLSAAFTTAIRDADSTHGGLSRGRPKFPSPMNYEFLLRHHARTGDPRALQIVRFSLEKMARGGIYDQVGGGFHRYSVDELWLVPHFEKMLYDNAQLSRLYLSAWAATDNPFFRQIAIEIYDYILREMTAPDGGFYSTTDADSEGEEGKFFVWQIAELRETLSADEFSATLAYWGVTAGGNFEGHNILHVPFDLAEVAANMNISAETLQGLLASAKDKLYAARTHRIHPARDEKIITAWNGMMLASFAEAGRLLNRPDYTEAAIANANFLLANLRTANGRLLRSHKDGQSMFNGYLEDYANLADGLLALYQTTFDTHYYAEAVALAEIMLTHFPAPEGGFYDTSDDHEKLIARPRNLQDNATASGNSAAANVFLTLAALSGDARYETAAIGVLRQLVAGMRQYPVAFGGALNAVSALVAGFAEVAIVRPAGKNADHLLRVLNSGYRPFVVQAMGDAATSEIPLLQDRVAIGGEASAYLCRKFVCQRPVTEAVDLAAMLNS
jgi:uncharacterized protein